jgi:hypothetical protein
MTTGLIPRQRIACKRLSFLSLWFHLEALPVKYSPHLIHPTGATAKDAGRQTGVYRFGMMGRIMMRTIDTDCSAGSAYKIKTATDHENRSCKMHHFVLWIEPLTALTRNVTVMVLNFFVIKQTTE